MGPTANSPGDPEQATQYRTPHRTDMAPMGGTQIASTNRHRPIVTQRMARLAAGVVAHTASLTWSGSHAPGHARTRRLARGVTGDPTPALESLTREALPEEPAISAITLAELAAAPHATDDEHERARRQDRLQRVEALLDPLPFDAAAARAYARAYAATRTAERKHLATVGLDVRSV